MNNIFVNTRSSIKITGTKTIYFDPLDIEGTPHDADMVFVTHEYYGDTGVGETFIKLLRHEIEVQLFW